MDDKIVINENSKIEQLQQCRENNTGGPMTSDAGLKIADDEWSLRAGQRGPTLLQDFHFFKKQSHFNRERIPERVVHARGYGAHGYFECTKSMKEYTTARLLQEVGCKVPIFVRFSTLQGGRGSKDTAQDVRGFAVKFYTDEGNLDLLALQFQVFLVADAMKFVDAVHALKPEPHSDIPQATSAHDNFWDYVANNQETTHMILWLISGRGRPRSWRMMDGYPINTFRFINEQGKSTFVRFHFKAVLGVHSLLLDEANIIGGVDPDYHRRDLIEAIERGAYPEYEFGVQLIPEEDEFKYDFDVLDDTKLWPEENVPLEIIGKMTLNKLTDNEFAETEQAGFDPSNLVPGIDFSNDPVLQGRSFAYRDTHYHRLGTGNVEEIPINRPLVKTNFNHRDSFVKHRIDADRVNYHRNSLANNTPSETSAAEGGYEHYPGKVEGQVTREVPSSSFTDFFSQARMFWNSMSAAEKGQLIETFNFHLGMVKSVSVRQQNVDLLGNVDKEMATEIAKYLGVNPPSGDHVPVTKSSPALSMDNMPRSAYTQKVGVLIGNGFNDKEVQSVLNALNQNTAFYDIVSDKLGTVTGANGLQIQVNKMFITTHPVLFDSLYVVGGNTDGQSKFDQDITEYVKTAYKYYKPIGISSGAEHYIQETGNLAGVVFAKDSANFADDFVTAVSQQRFWDRS
ncbi:MAG: catalase [Christensenellales bacterium]|jgi:catalase